MVNKNKALPSLYSLDRGLILVVLFFLGLGLVQVYSSSYIHATETMGDGLHFVHRQLLFLVAGIVVMLATAMFPWPWIQKFFWGLWLVVFCALVLTLIPGIGVKVGGASRWLQLPWGFRIEPGEFLKFLTPLFLSLAFLNKKNLTRGNHILFGVLFFALPGLLLLRQPDFGSFVILSLVAFGLLFAFGLRWIYVLATVAASLPLFYFLVVKVPYRWARVEAFLDPWAEQGGGGFQVIQSMLSFHAGGISGVGLGNGQSKLLYLPEAHNDFTLAVLGEELGFLGVAFIFMLFGFLFYRGFQIALTAKDSVLKGCALGVSLVFCSSFLVNAGVVLGVLPTKGLTLPFLSYGGSSLVASCIGIGLLLNIDRQNRLGARH